MQDLCKQVINLGWDHKMYVVHLHVEAVGQRALHFVQLEYHTPEAAAARQAAAAAAAAMEDVAAVHEDNEWAIEVLAKEGEEEGDATGHPAGGEGNDALPEGLHFSMPVKRREFIINGNQGVGWLYR